MNTNTEILGNNRATARASLGGVPGVNAYNLCSGSFSLVAEKGKQLAPSGIMHALGKARLGQTKDIQVFNEIMKGGRRIPLPA